MQRYSNFGDMTEDPDGEWVRYSDYVAAMKLAWNGGQSLQRALDNLEAMKRIAGDGAQQEPVMFHPETGQPLYAAPQAVPALTDHDVQSLQMIEGWLNRDGNRDADAFLRGLAEKFGAPQPSGERK